MSKLVSKVYKFYSRRVSDFILLLVIFLGVFASRYVPYVNLLIVNMDPLLSSIVVVWIIFYFITVPQAKKIFTWALIVFSLNIIFVIVKQIKVGEILASLSYVMLFTGVIKEIGNLRRESKKDLFK